jgi:hypothetical protein
VLILAVLLAGMAVTAHPAGVVAVAPLLVCIPRVWRDARRGQALSPLSLAIVPAVGFATALVLAFFDTDVARRDDTIELVRRGFHSKGPLQELERYANLSGAGSSVIRREFVLLLLLAIAALAIGKAWGRRTLPELLPTASIGLGLVLLSLTPSKWIWHFAGFIGIAAVGIALETERLRRHDTARLGRFGVAVAVLALSLLAARRALPWGPVDLGDLTWHHSPSLYVVAAFAAIAVVVVLGRTRLHRPELAAIPVVATALLGVTMLALAADALVTEGWTAPRQMLSSLAPGSGSCGLADDVVIPAVDSMQRLQPVDNGRSRQKSSRDSEPLFALPPSQARVWYEAPSAPIGTFVRSERPSADRIVAVWGRTTPSGVRRLRAGMVRVPAPSVRRPRAEWTLIPESGFPKRPQDADAILIFTRGGMHPDGGARLPPPISFRSAPLDRILASASTRSLVDPFLFEATPCADLPTLTLGVADVPSLQLEWHLAFGFEATSPFRGVTDLFDTLNVPLENWNYHLWFMMVNWVLDDPRDAVAPARHTSG